MMTTLVFDFIGLIFGTIIGLLKFSSPYIGIFLIFLLGGVFPLLPIDWFQYFPGWFEKVILLFGFIFIVFSLFPWNKLNSDKLKKCTLSSLH